MVKDKLKEHVLTAFTTNGDYVAILSANGTAKIWNTNSGDLLADWRPSDGDEDTRYSCIACSFTGKKRRKDQGTCILALGTDDGEVLAVDVSTGDRKWPTSHTIPSGICGLSFAKKGQLLCVVGHDGKAYEINSETGELLKEFRVSKKSISSLAFSHDEKYLAIFSSRLRVISRETGKEVLKCPSDLENIDRVSLSNDAKYLITSDSEAKHLKVWKCDLSSGTVSSGPTLSSRHAPLVLDCHLGGNEEDDLVVSAVTSGGTYIWKNLNASSEDQVHRTKITSKTEKVESEKENGVSSKKKRTSIIASRFQSTGEDGQMKALVTYGSADHPKFTVLNISDLGENVVLNVGDELDSIQKHDSPSKKAVEKESKKSKKRQATSDPDLPTTTDKLDFDQLEDAEGVLDDDPSEPTMGEKLASLNLVDEHKSKSDKEQESLVSLKPPSADSVDVLLKQALNADDRALLLDCLYTQDEKVIIKSVAQLNPSNVLKLLNSLITIIESRGAILACALPWLKCLLLQHASGIMSQESSLKVLNSLFQLIESRVSSFKSVFQLSSFLDIHYTGVLDEEVDEVETVPIIYVDTDDSEGEESEDVMETDQDSKDGELSDEALDNLNDIEGSDGMMED